MLRRADVAGEPRTRSESAQVHSPGSLVSVPLLHGESHTRPPRETEGGLFVEMSNDPDYYRKNRDRIIARSLEWKKNNPEKHKEQHRRYTQRLRARVLAKYGSGCACCGEARLAFLTIDHIDGGGNKHRKELTGSGSGEHLYRWLRDNNYPSGFQVLCWNCNCGRSLNGGVCPHAESTENGLHPSVDRTSNDTGGSIPSGSREGKWS